MNKEQQRYLIASRLLRDKFHFYNKNSTGGVCWNDIDKAVTEKEWLGVMHLAESQLAIVESNGWSQQKQYAHCLGEVTNNDNGRGWQPLSSADCFPILHAREDQRREALLKTLGLWEEEA